MSQYFLFIRQNGPLLLFGFISIFWGSLGQSFFISWYGASIQDSLHLSAAAYGGIYSTATLISGLSIIYVGGLIDRMSLFRFTLLAAFGLLTGCIIMATSQNSLSLIIGFFLLRLCGQGLLPHTAQTTMARYFNNNRGKALSISGNGVPIGETLLPISAVALISIIGWRNSWFVFAASVLLLYIPLTFWLLQKQSKAAISIHKPATNSMTKSLGRIHVLTDYRFWLALPAILATPFILTGIFIHQGFILEQKNWTATWLASCFIIMGLAHGISSLISGVLVDKFSASRLLPFMLLPLLLALLTLAFLNGNLTALLFMSFLGMSIGATSPVIGALWAEIYGTENLGAIRSLMASIIIVSTAIAPILFGLFIDANITAYTLFSITAGMLIIVSLVSYFSYGFGYCAELITQGETVRQEKT